MICFALNNQWIDAKKPIISLESRLFKYGDGFFQSMLYHQKNILFFEHHLERIINGLETLLLPPPTLFNLQNISTFIQSKAKEMQWETCSIRMSFLRESFGTYTPTSKEETTVITQIQASNFYKLPTINENTLVAYTAVTKHADGISHIKHCNSLIYVLAAKYATLKNATAALIFNSLGNLCEAHHSNIFILRNSKLYTPSLASGCQNGTMRQICIQIAKEMGLTVVESELKKEDLINASEVFLTNISNGINPIHSFESCTYNSEISLILQQKLIQKITI